MSRILGGVAAGLIAVSVIRLRMRRRDPCPRRCPRCGYDLSHSPGLRCSECGFLARKVEQLRTVCRGSRLPAAALLVAIGGYACLVTPAAKDRGWPAAVPTPVLMVSLPWLRPDLDAHDPLGWTMRQLWSRRNPSPPVPASTWRNVALTELIAHRPVIHDQSSWQYRMLRHICTAMSDTAADDWLSSGDMVLGAIPWAGDRTLSWRSLGAWADRHMMSRLPAPRISTRHRWPRGATIYGRVLAQSLPGGGRIIGEARHANGIDWQIRREEFSGSWSSYGPVHSSLWREPLRAVGTADGSPLAFDCTYQTAWISTPISLSRFRDIHSEPLDVEYQTVEQADDLIQPVRDAALDELLAANMRPVLRYGRFDSGSRYALDVIGVLRTTPDDAAFLPTLAFEAEIVFDDRVIGTARAWYPSTGTGYSVGSRHIEVNVMDEEAVSSLTKTSVVTVRLRGDGDLVLHDLDSTRYWAGEIELPLVVDIHNPDVPY